MNAAAATIFWSQFGRPQPDDESSSFGLMSAGLSPAMNAAAATLSWSQFSILASTFCGKLTFLKKLRPFFKFCILILEHRNRNYNANSTWCMQPWWP
jgi:hypothetical protein